jgi:hypothetical protein
MNFANSSGKATNRNALVAFPNGELKKDRLSVHINGSSNSMAGAILKIPSKKQIRRCFLGSLLYSSLKMMYDEMATPGAMAKMSQFIKLLWMKVKQNYAEEQGVL